MWSGREEQAVFKGFRQFTDGSRNLGINGIFPPRSRCCMVRFIQDEQGAWPERPKPFAEARRVSIVD